MSRFDKFLALMMAGHAVRSAWLYDHLTREVAAFVVLLVITSIMGMLLTAVAFYVLFIVLIYAGIDEVSALTLVGALPLLISLVLAGLIRSRLRRLKGGFRNSLELPFSFVSETSALAMAFLAGFTAQKRD